VTDPEDHFKAAKAEYLKESYPGDLAEVLGTQTKDHVTAAPVIESPVRRRRVSSGWIVMSLTIAGLVLAGVIDRSNDPQPRQLMTKSNSAKNDSMVGTAARPNRHRKSFSKMFTLSRPSSLTSAPVNQKRLRLFTSLSIFEMPNVSASTKRKTATLALSSSGHRHATKTRWWKSGSITLASRPTGIRRSGKMQRKTNRSQRTQKRSTFLHRFHFDPLNRSRSS